MLKELKAFYIENGISAMSFESNMIRCKYYEDCSTKKLDGRKKKPFDTAKEAFISTGYELHKIPRILVISLDPKYSEYYKDPQQRTLENVREHEEFSLLDSYYDWSKNSHWRKTYDCLFILIRKFLKSRDRNDLRHIFAHTNSSKCHDKPGSEQASDELFYNCVNYLPTEIKILDPDIIITQGNKKYFTFMRDFPIVNNMPSYFENYQMLSKVHPIILNNHHVIWIEMNHPCRHDGLYKNEDESNFIQYSELIYEFWQSH